jgi:hypothetical protein
MKVRSVIPVGVGAAAVMLFAAGAMAQDQAPAAGGDDAGAKMRKAMREAMSFENMDADKDGKVTLEEFKAAQAKLQELRFRQMDADGDGKLTKEEVDKSREGFGRGGMQRGGRGGGGKDGNL